MAAGDVAFGSFNLNDGTYRVQGPLPIPASGPDVLSLPFARREGSGVAMSRFPQKTFAFQVVIRAATVQAREDALDAMLKALANGEQNFKSGWQDERYYRARLAGEVTVQRFHGTSHFACDVRLLIADPFAYAASASQDAPGATLFTRP